MLGDKKTEKLTSKIVKSALAILRGESKIRSSISKANTEYGKTISDAIKICEKNKESQGEDGKNKTNIIIGNYRKAASAGASSASTMAGCITNLCSNALSVCKKAYVSRPKKTYGENPYKKESGDSILDQF